MNTHLDRGATLLSHNLYGEAEKELRLALSQNPDSALAHHLLASALSLQGKLDEALKEGEAALALAPEDDQVYYVLAGIHQYRENLGKAQSCIEQALRFCNDDPDYLSLAAMIQIGKNNWQRARELAETGLAVESEHILCINARAYALARLSQVELARQDLERALALEPNNDFTHTNMALLLIKGGEIDKAASHLQEALRLDPNSEMAQQALLDAIKSRSPIYHRMLLFTHWLTEMGGKKRVVFILILLLIPALRSLVLLTLLLIWSANHLFTFLLRMDPLGKRILTEQQKRDNTKGVVVVFLILAFFAFIFLGKSTSRYIAEESSDQLVKQIKEAQINQNQERASKLLERYLKKLRGFLERKRFSVAEVMLTSLDEQKPGLSKDQQLELYLNRLYLYRNGAQDKQTFHQGKEIMVLTELRLFLKKTSPADLAAALKTPAVQAALQRLKIQDPRTL